jgi:glucokinase
MSKVVIGIDLGGTNIKTAVVSEDRVLLAKDSRSTNANAGPEAVMDAMALAVNETLAQAGKSREDVIAACFGAPGPMNWQTGVVYSPPNLPGWKNVPLAEGMQQRLGFPCYIDNDANVACYGEYWMGAGRGTENMAVLTLGTGVGGGVIVFGKLLRGPDGTAAELGHLVVCRYGRDSTSPARGALESYASVTGMVRTAVEGLEAGKESSLRERCGGDLSQITGAMISEEVEAGDAFAQWVFEETATWLALGIVSIIHYQNPEKVVLCGGMIAAGDRLFDTVRRVVRENTFEVPGNRCQIVPAGLGSDSGVLGAAGCAYARATESFAG